MHGLHFLSRSTLCLFLNTAQSYQLYAFCKGTFAQSHHVEESGEAPLKGTVPASGNHLIARLFLP